MTHDAHYKAIAKKTGFELPELYRKLIADGVTEYGSSRAEWKTTWKKRSVENPPALLLASSHVEWYSPKTIAEYEPAPYWRKDLVLVPVAQNGGGDLWCFHPAAGQGGDVPLAFCPQD